MKRFALPLAAVALLAPQTALASDAFLTQVSAGPARVTLGAQPAAPTAESVLAQLDLAIPRVSAPIVLPDLDAYPLPGVPTSGAVADIQSIGNGLSATIVQSGVNAGMIRQTGDLNSAAILQSGQANVAAIYQASSGATAMTIQSGSNNSALIVQR